MRQEEERKIATLRRDKNSRLLDAANDNIDKDEASRSDKRKDNDANSNSSGEDNEASDRDSDSTRGDAVDNAALGRYEDADAEDMR